MLQPCEFHICVCIYQLGVASTHEQMCFGVCLCVDCDSTLLWRHAGDKLPPVRVSQPYGFWCSSMIGPVSAGYEELQRKPGINWNPVVCEPSAQSVCLSVSTTRAPSIQLLKEREADSADGPVKWICIVP